MQVYFRNWRLPETLRTVDRFILFGIAWASLFMAVVLVLSGYGHSPNYNLVLLRVIQPASVNELDYLRAHGYICTRRGSEYRCVAERK